MEVTSSLHTYYLNSVIHNSNVSDSLLVHYLLLKLFSLHSEITYKLPYSVGVVLLLLNLLEVRLFLVKHSFLGEIYSFSGFCAFFPYLHPTTLTTSFLPP